MKIINFDTEFVNIESFYFFLLSNKVPYVFVLIASFFIDGFVADGLDTLQSSHTLPAADINNALIGYSSLDGWNVILKPGKTSMQLWYSSSFIIFRHVHQFQFHLHLFALSIRRTTKKLLN